MFLSNTAKFRYVLRVQLSKLYDYYAYAQIAMHSADAISILRAESLLF